MSKQHLILFTLALASSAFADYSPIREQIDPGWKARIEPIAAEAATQVKAHNRRLLVFYRTEGFCHRASIIAGNEAFRIAAKAGAWQVDFADEYDALRDENLRRYDALVLFNTTNLRVEQHPFVAHAIVDFVKFGRGLAVIHAGNDGFSESPEILYMIGGRFAGHPWGAGGTWDFRNEDPSSPLNAMFPGEKFTNMDEIYLQRSPYFSRCAEHVLVSLDLGAEKTGGALARSRDMRRPDGFYPVSWVRRYGRGRVFYTSFGHDERTWFIPMSVKHIFAGVFYALREIDANDSPSDPEMLPPPSDR